MQRLIKRASDLKDLKKEKDRIDVALFKDVAPWFLFSVNSKKVNEDLEGLDEGVTQVTPPNKHYALVMKLLQQVNEERREWN